MDIYIYTTKCKTDSWWEAAASQGEISLMLCDHLEGWDRECGRPHELLGKYKLKLNEGTSLVAQLLRICLPMQGTQVRALV